MLTLKTGNAATDGSCPAALAGPIHTRILIQLCVFNPDPYLDRSGCMCFNTL